MVFSEFFSDSHSDGGCLATKSCPTLVTPSIVLQDPLSMGYPSQEFWSGLPFPSPGDLPDPGIKSMSPALLVHFLSTEFRGKPRYNGHLS